jgi:hypothetical protein
MLAARSAAAPRSFAMPTEAFIIETPYHTAGIAVRERSGFRFYPSDALFQAFGQRTFRGLHDLQDAINRLSMPRAARAGEYHDDSG